MNRSFLLSLVNFGAWVDLSIHVQYLLHAVSFQHFPRVFFQDSDATEGRSGVVVDESHFAGSVVLGRFGWRF